MSNLISADLFLTATATADKIAYFWEKEAIKELAEDGITLSRRGGSLYEVGEAGKLKAWQVKRLIKYGLATEGTEYDPNWPEQSRFDAPVTFYGLRPTELCKIVAQIV